MVRTVSCVFCAVLCLVRLPVQACAAPENVSNLRPFGSHSFGDRMIDSIYHIFELPEDGEESYNYFTRNILGSPNGGALLREMARMEA